MALLSLTLLALALVLVVLRGFCGLLSLLLLFLLLVQFGLLAGGLCGLRGRGLVNVEVVHFLLNALGGHVDVVSGAIPSLLSER